jgi:basic membrane protein A
MRNSKRVSALALSASLLFVAACGSDEDEAVTTDAPVTSEAPAGSAAPAGTEAGATPVSACEVTDVGGADDKGFNQSAYDGLKQAETDLGATIDLLESDSADDYAPNIDAFVEKDCSLIVTVGFLLGSATATAAKANPDQQFAIIDSDANDDAGTPDDSADDINLENVRALNFSTDQPSFIAGYLAAGMTTTGTVATFGGINIPPVTIFMTGFLDGVNYYNTQKGTTVKVLGWDGTEGSFAGNFESLDDGKKLAQGFADEGADIIFPVAGPVGLGASAYALEVGGIKIIGVDVDQYISNDKEKSVYLTSVLKKIDAAVLDSITNVANDGVAGSDYLGTFENGGVGIAEYHDFDSEVPAELKTEVDALIAAFTAGDMTAMG